MEKEKMTENIAQMRERHKQEIETLQKNCKHEKLSGWIDEQWALAHSTGNQVKVCEFCDKVIERKKYKLNPVRIISGASKFKNMKGKKYENQTFGRSVTNKNFKN